MGTYVTNNLLKGETVRYEVKNSLWSFIPYYLGGLVLLPFYGIGLLLWLAVVLIYASTELAITNKRVIAKFGFIRRQSIEINIPKVESVQVDQSILGRIFNYGDIVVSGAGNPKAPIPGIDNPLAFRKAFFEIQEQLESEKQSDPAHAA